MSIFSILVCYAHNFHVYTCVGEMAEHSVHNVGHRGPGIPTTGMEYVLLRHPLSDSRGGQHRQREIVSHERRIVSHARK